MEYNNNRNLSRSSIEEYKDESKSTSRSSSLNSETYRTFETSPLSLSRSGNLSLQQSFDDQVYRSIGASERSNPNDIRPLFSNLDISGPSSFGSKPYFDNHNHTLSNKMGFGTTTTTTSSNKMGLSIPYQYSSSFQTRAVPPRTGGYLEPYYHFLTNVDPNTLMISLEKMLNSLNQQNHKIDYKVISGNFRFECHVYSHAGGRTSFNIRIFTQNNKSDQKYAIEFQRTCGDRVHFCGIYRECLSHLDQAILSQTTAKIPNTTRKLGELPPLEPINDDIKRDHCYQGINSLLQMVSAPYLDSQTEAIRALAGLCQNADKLTQQVLLDSGVVQSFIASLNSASCDISRCAITGLAHLTALASKPLCTAIVMANGLTAALGAANRNTCPHIKREVVRMYRAIVENLRDSLAIDKHTADIHLKCLKEIAKKETTVRENVEAIIQVHESRQQAIQI